MNTSFKGFKSNEFRVHLLGKIPLQSILNFVIDIWKTSCILASLCVYIIKKYRVLYCYKMESLYNNARGNVYVSSNVDK